MINSDKRKKLNFSLSVVVTTLGNHSLIETIESVNKSSIIPMEILICIPRSRLNLLEEISFKHNVRIITAPLFSQVEQRILGFRHAKGAFVLQLDDDIVLRENCIELLIKAMQNSSLDKIAVGPNMLDKITGKSLHSRPNWPKPFKYLYHFLTGGYSGSRLNLLSSNASKNVGKHQIYNVDWLAGGCVLHKRENLILDSFYPFSGKAYCEDLIHSHYLSCNGVILCINLDSCCEVDYFSPADLSFRDYWKLISSESKARLFYFKLINKNLFFIYFYYFFEFLFYLIKNCNKFLKKF